MTFPATWTTYKLGELAQYINGRAFKPDEWKTSGLPIIRIQNLTDRSKPFNYCDEKVDPRYYIKDGDLLIAWSATLGSFIWDRGPAVLNQHIFKAVPNKDLVERDFLHFLMLEILDEMASHAHGIAMKHITKRKFEAFEVAIPSLPEQRRIVARIKECVERVEEIVRLRLDIARSNELLSYSCVSDVIRQLKSEYRSESIEHLLAGASDAMRSGPFGSAMRHNEFVADGNLVIGIANVQQNWFDPTRKWMISERKFEEMKRYSVEPGDVLITIMGTIGRTCVVPEDVGRAITSKHVYRIRFPKSSVVPKYLSYLINFDREVRSQLFGTAMGGVMPGLNSTKLKNLKICVPPLDIQHEVVSRLDLMHSAVSLTESLRAGDQFVRLREAILCKAFTGEL